MNVSTVRLCSSFVVGVAAGAGIVIFYNANRSCLGRRATGITPLRRHSLSAPKEKSSVTAAANDEIVAEQFTRNVQFFGIEAQKKVADAFVVVIGLGGVCLLYTSDAADE